MAKLTREILDRAEVAAIKLGYSPKSARRTASRIFRRPEFPGIILQRMYGLESTAKHQYKRLADAYLEDGVEIAALRNGDYSPAMSRLCTIDKPCRKNERHVRFVEGLFLLGWNLTKAAVYAGYSPRWAGTNTPRLMNPPCIRGEIFRIRCQLIAQEFGPSPSFVRIVIHKGLGATPEVDER